MAGSPGDLGLPAQPQPGQAPPADADRTRTLTAAGVPAPVPPRADRPGGDAGSPGEADDARVVRYGPGVPAPGSRPAPTAEQVWRTGLPDAPRHPRRPLRLAGAALSVALLAASGAVIYLRLHHGPFGVTAVAITSEVRKGCTEDVTGRIDTTGAAGTVSYQWVFAAAAAAPQPLRQSVASGQSAVYVTAAVEGQGHGRLTQTVTLQVLGPGQGRASAQVTLSC